MLDRDQQDVRTWLRASGAPPEALANGQGAPVSVRFPAILHFFLQMLSILFLCLRMGFSQQVENNHEAVEVVRGTVVNKLTHDPISRALVHSLDNRFATLTDGEGHFEFKVSKKDSQRNDSSGTFVFQSQSFSAGPNLLAARKPGFLDDPVSREVPVSAGVDATIFLIPEAIIQGRVSVSSAELSRSITLQLFKRQINDGRPHWIGRGTEHTNANGEFRFAELGPGEYKIMTLEQLDSDPQTVVAGGLLYGFPPSCFPGVPDFQSGPAIQLAVGQTFEAGMTLTRQPYFPVRIPAANVDPLSGMNISVLAQGHPGPGYSLGYNPSTHRIEGLLPSGTYLIQANVFGTNQVSGMMSITVAGREVDGPMLALASTTPIPVHVKEEFTSTNQPVSRTWNDGKRSYSLHGPRAYLQIYLESVEDFSPGGGGALRPPTSPEDQTLEITNAVPGRYWVHVDSSRGYPASITAGDVDLRQDPLFVSTGANAPIEITMRDDGATIEGTVAGRNLAAPVKNVSLREPQVAPRVWVYCLPLSGSTGRFQQFAPSREGKFTSPAMAPGAYRVLAFDGPQPELPYREAEAMRAYDTLGQVVNLVAGQTVHLELEPIASGE